jgi:hypothetical protein
MKRLLCGLLFFTTLFTSIHAEPKYVGEAATNSLSLSKRKEWQNWIFAISMTAITVVALVLLSQHHHNHHDHDKSDKS